MTDMEASLGSVQLAHVEERWKSRQKVWRALEHQLRDLPLHSPPPPEPQTRHSYHLYSVLLQPERLLLSRNSIVDALNAEGIGVGVHYVPIHQQPYYRAKFGFRPSDFPQAQFVGQRTFSLPLSPEMSEQDVADVCFALGRVLRYYAKLRFRRGTAVSVRPDSAVHRNLADKSTEKHRGH